MHNIGHIVSRVVIAYEIISVGIEKLEELIQMHLFILFIEQYLTHNMKFLEYPHHFVYNRKTCEIYKFKSQNYLRQSIYITKDLNICILIFY